MKFPQAWAEICDDEPSVAIRLWKGNGIQVISEESARVLRENLDDALKTLESERAAKPLPGDSEVPR